MAKKTIKAQMKQRRDTKANWAATNPVLLDGELGIVSDDPNLYKVGDGATAWNRLPFRGFDGTLAQELGTSPNAVISQKVVSEKLTELGSRLKIKDSLIQGEYYNTNGTIGASSTYMRLPIIKASDKLAIIGFNSKIVYNGGCRCFDSTGQYIGDVDFTNIQERDYIYDLPDGTASIGLYFKTSVIVPDDAFIESPVGLITKLYKTGNDALKGENILQDASLWRAGYINSRGTNGITTLTSNELYKFVLIPVSSGDSFIYYYQGTRNDLNCFFNNNLDKVGDNIYMDNGVNHLITPEGATYLGLTIQFGASDSYQYKWLVRDNTPIAAATKEAVAGNIFKITQITDYLVKGTYWQNGGYIGAAETFDRTELIPAQKGFYYTGCTINNVRCFNSSKQWISDEALADDKYTQYVSLSEDTAYIGVNFKVENQPDLTYADAYFIMDTNPLIKPILEKDANASVLSKKKWYFAGDSFSAGIGLEKFTSGAFSGKPKTYPYLIALRNGMLDIVNDGISGSAMTYNPNDNRTSNAYSVSRYKNIPNDVDYITLYFGINDSNYKSELGTIDDEVNTTFYGAWNIVMKHIITNHPLAKIGIIITNGAEPKFTEAERAIAKKYGVSYLDMELDDKVPHFLRQAEKVAALGIPQEIVNLRTQTYALNPPSDTHPNEKAHEFESTFIEAWMKTL